MQVTLREYMGSQECDRRPLALHTTPITIGRSESCTYTIGKTLGKLGGGISRIHATITESDDGLTLFDGGADGVSENGIYCHTERINGSIALVPGLELTLFKHGIAKVSLSVVCKAVVEHGGDTYTGQELLSVLQENVQALGGEAALLRTQVGLLDVQIKQRETIDANQEERLLMAEKRLHRVVSVSLAAIAAIVLASGWLSGNNEDKKQWSSTLTSIVIGVAALYFKSKEPPK